jgi:hypothetical protein
MTVKPIETRYRGYLFRSRLEARWAVYFDALELEWEYEKEGFNLDGLLYLPDFWLPQPHWWAEVKPEAFSTGELRKAARLAWKHSPVILLKGPPALRTYDFLHFEEAGTWGEIGCGIGIDDVGEDEGLVIATDCVISMYHGYPVHEHRFYSSTGGVSDRDFRHDGLFDDVPAAVAAARSARFEHGQSGPT